jgi:hypothetical protein
MEVPGRAPDGARARIGALPWPVPVRSPGPPESAADRRSGPLSALAEERLGRVVRLAAMVPDAPQASVKVPGKRCSLRRTCPASTRAEAQGKTLPSVILAARNQTLPNWVTDDQRFLTAIYAITLAPNGSGHEMGGQPGCGGAWLAAQSRQPRRTTPTATTMRCLPYRPGGPHDQAGQEVAVLSLDKPEGGLSPVRGPGGALFSPTPR